MISKNYSLISSGWNKWCFCAIMCFTMCAVSAEFPFGIYLLNAVNFKGSNNNTQWSNLLAAVIQILCACNTKFIVPWICFGFSICRYTYTSELNEFKTSAYIILGDRK